MKCPLCSVEGRIQKTYNKVRNDDTPDKKTELFTVQEVECRNKNCSNFRKIFQTVEHQIPLE